MIQIPKGGTAYLQLTLAKGRYAYASQNSDLDTDPNAVLGEFTVK